MQSTPVTSSVQNAGKEPQSTPLISTPQNKTSGRMAAQASALPKNPQHEPSEDASLQDKHIVVALPSKGDETNQPRGVVKPCGLDNLGNTCYMNAALQGLGSVADLKDYFLYGMYSVCCLYTKVLIPGRVQITLYGVIVHFFSSSIEIMG